MAWYVDIVTTETGETERAIPCRNERGADRVFKAIGGKLNRDVFHLVIDEREEE